MPSVAFEEAALTSPLLMWLDQLQVLYETSSLCPVRCKWLFKEVSSKSDDSYAPTNTKEVGILLPCQAVSDNCVTSPRRLKKSDLVLLPETALLNLLMRLLSTAVIHYARDRRVLSCAGSRAAQHAPAHWGLASRTLRHGGVGDSGLIANGSPELWLCDT